MEDLCAEGRWKFMGDKLIIWGRLPNASVLDGATHEQDVTWFIYFFAYASHYTLSMNLKSSLCSKVQQKRLQNRGHQKGRQTTSCIHYFTLTLPWYLKGFWHFLFKALFSSLHLRRVTKEGLNTSIERERKQRLAKVHTNTKKWNRCTVSAGTLAQQTFKDYEESLCSPLLYHFVKCQFFFLHIKCRPYFFKLFDRNSSYKNVYSFIHLSFRQLPHWWQSSYGSRAKHEIILVHFYSCRATAVLQRTQRTLLIVKQIMQLMIKHI